MSPSGSWHHFVYATIVMCCLATVVAVATDDSLAPGDYTTRSPPLLVQYAAAEKAYKVGDLVTLPCEARGFPPPIYEWRRNGEKFNVNTTTGVRQVPGVGTIEITIDELHSQHDGLYQCLAYNEYGTAVSMKTHLRQATLDPFPTIKEPKVHRVAVGSSLTLTCQPPASYPTGTVYWGQTNNGPKVRPIDNNDRISLDYDGNLHFSHVEMSDVFSTNQSYLCVLASEELRTLVQGSDQRIILRPGNLLFSNVEESDSQLSALYVCVVYNAELRNIVEGDDQRIEPFKTTERPRYEPPRLMWSSVTSDIAIKGQTKKMKCIFSGFPTPTVRWVRVDGYAMPAKNNLNSSFGQELVIPDADFSDSGRYQCTAANSAANTVVRNFTLKVESTPYWRDDQRPESIDTAEDEDAVFECNVNGFPKPIITWTVNGKSLDEYRNPRRSLDGNKLVFRGVLKSDAQVVQCNASNPHGYIFFNAYLNVLAEPPSFREAPRSQLKAALGGTAILTCRVFGAPKPTIVWQKGSNLEDVEGYHDRRYVRLANGDLEIQGVNHYDNDTYQCYACNKFGCDARSGLLLVIEPTTIVNPPLSHQQATAGSNVTFYCNATTDPSERSRLSVGWWRGDVALTTTSGRPDDDNQVIDSNINEAIVISDSGRRLTIIGVKVGDTGKYTCSAENGVDSDTANVHMTVRDRPEPPTDIRLNNCQSTYADVSWNPGADNNDPITGYVVYFSTANDAELSATGGGSGQSSSSSSSSSSSLSSSALHEAMRVDAGKQSVRVRNLAPWNEYTFFVAAINAVGQSDAAKVTSSSTMEEGSAASGSSLTCSTPEAKPARSPNKVCTDSRKPDHLVIVWEPMLRSEHHGIGFHYVVTYQRLDRPSAEVQSHVVADWRQSELEIRNTPTYTEYKISVQAKNNQGFAAPTSVIGHSGEDVPLEIPRNFQLIESSLNATNAIFSWEPVDRSIERIRGFFKGYQIRFWRSENPSVYRTEDVILKPWRPCRPLQEDAAVLDADAHAQFDLDRRRRSTSGSGRSGRVRGATANLWPYSSITAAVVVLNGARTGELSGTVTFQTEQGVPGPVRALTVVERGSHHLKLSWQQPTEINGVLTGYDIRYREVSSDGAAVWETTIPETTMQTTKKIHELNHSTNYIVTVSAMTSKGRGVETTIQAITIRASPPDAPVLENIEIGYDYLLVNWLTSDKTADSNPASEFVVEFRPEGSTEWTSIGPEKDHTSINITDLVYGQPYEVRVIGRNKQYPVGIMSKTEKIIVGYQPAAESRDTAVASSSWFIVLICALSLLLLVLLVVGLFRYNRGGKYPVFEKERQHGTNGGHIEEEDRFCEFVRSEDPAKHKSQGSLESSSRSEEDEDGSDSLGIYEDGDPAKFNDDGSFVDQSGYKKIIDGPGRLQPQSPMMIVTATSPKTAPHTFV